MQISETSLAQVFYWTGYIYHADRTHTSTPSMGHITRLLPFLIALGFFSSGAGPSLVAKHGYLEFFSGDESISKGMRLYGYSGLSFDLRRCVDHNFLIPCGFLAALSACMRVRRGGLVWWAPPCSSWVFMSRSSTGRAVSVEGNPFNEAVQAQNILVRRLVHLLTLLIKRGVYFIVEQPRSSIMWKHPVFKRFLRRWSGLIEDAHPQLGAFSLESRKDTILKGYAPHLSSKRLQRKMSRQQRRWMEDGHKTQTTIYWKEDGGVKRSRGTKKLKSTQAYPLGLGCANAGAFFELSPPESLQEPHDLHPSDTDSDDTDSDDSCFADLSSGDAEYFAGHASVARSLCTEKAVQRNA